jgi:hypothetical protein
MHRNTSGYKSGTERRAVRSLPSRWLAVFLLSVPLLAPAAALAQGPVITEAFHRHALRNALSVAGESNNGSGAEYNEATVSPDPEPLTGQYLDELQYRILNRMQSSQKSDFMSGARHPQLLAKPLARLLFLRTYADKLGIPVN